MKFIKIIKIIFVMVLISGFSGFILAFYWNISAQKIKNNEELKLKQAFFEINPNISTFNMVIKENKKIYYGHNKTGDLESLFFIGEGNGFQGNIKIVICTDSKITKILGLKILEQAETPGLGSEITKPSFLNQFKDISVLLVIKCLKKSAIKEISQINAISGATISSQALVDIINNTMRKIREIQKKEESDDNK